ncbi:hypothetical protein [Mucilaginibacter terrae]|uniref:Uncharacterized protein n=1 Tax=Mucilaginibacter terrae TaxID=1955052 RepID=A0ABU3GMT1_9SPHI|nr:hypothetical protein [Mucilaginibacter terrae]MDT3401052.1 hypothetical protein [Mucilaginibacter terrae]
MKNFKQIALGLLVGTMAIGFSSFTNSKNTSVIHKDVDGKIISVTSKYFRLPAFASNTQDTDPSHYVFSNALDADCNTGTNNICSSQWTTDVAPTNGQSPDDVGTPMLSSDNSQRGIYNGE